MNKKVVKDFFTCALGSFFLKIMWVILSPFMILQLTLSQLGLWALINSFIAIVTLILGLGLRQAFMLEYIHANSDQKKELINDILLLYILFAIPFGLLLGAIFVYINQEKLLLSIAFLISFITFFIELLYQELSLRQQITTLVWIQILVACVTISLALFFLLFLKWGLIGIFLAQFLGLLVACFLSLSIYIRAKLYLYVSVRRSVLKAHSYYKISLPFLPSLLAGWFFSSGGRWLLSKTVSFELLGIFSIAEFLSQLYQTVILYPISTAYVPYMLGYFKNNQQDIVQADTRNLKYMYIFLSILLLLLCLVYLFVVYLPVPASYCHAIPLAFGLLIAQILLTGTYFATCLMQFFKKSVFLISSFVVAAVIYALLAYTLIPQYQLLGAVIALIGAYSVYFIWILWYNMSLKNLIQRGKLKPEQFF